MDYTSAYRSAASSADDFLLQLKLVEALDSTTIRASWAQLDSSLGFTIKIFDYDAVTTGEQQYRLKQEFRLLKHLPNHPNILRPVLFGRFSLPPWMKDALVDTPVAHSDQVHLMVYPARTNTLDQELQGAAIDSTDRHEDQLLNWSTDIISAGLALTAAGIVPFSMDHKRLCIFESDGTSHLQLYVGDQAFHLDPSAASSFSVQFKPFGVYSGKKQYTAPEVFNQIAKAEMLQGSGTISYVKQGSWAVGTCLYQLFSGGDLPFSDYPNSYLEDNFAIATLATLAMPDSMSTLPAELQDCVRRLLDDDANVRLSLDSAAEVVDMLLGTDAQDLSAQPATTAGTTTSSPIATVEDVNVALVSTMGALATTAPADQPTEPTTPAEPAAIIPGIQSTLAPIANETSSFTIQPRTTEVLPVDQSAPIDYSTPDSLQRALQQHLTQRNVVVDALTRLHSLLADGAAAFHADCLDIELQYDLCTVINEYINDPLVCEVACTNLAHLVTSPRADKCVAQADALPLIGKVMTQHMSVPGCMKEVCFVLRQMLVHLNSCTEAAVQLGLLNSVKQILTQHQVNRLIMEQATWTCYGASLVEAGRASVLSADIHTTLIEVFNLHAEDGKIVQAILQTIACLACDSNSSRSVLVDVKALDCIMNSLQLHKTASDVVAAAFTALWEMTVLPAVSEKIWHMGVYQHMLDALRSFTSDEVHNPILGTLRNMIFLPEIRTKVISEDLFQLLKTVMTTHAQSLRLQRTAAALLRNFSECPVGEQKVLISAGLTQIMCKALRIHASNTDLAEYCFTALWNLSVDDEAVAAFMERQVLIDIRTAMQRHRRNPRVLEAVLGVLRNICAKPEYVPLLFEHGMISEVFLAMDMHKTNEHVISYTCRCLRNCALVADVVPELLKHKVLDRINEAISNHPQKSSVCFHAFACLGSLAFSDTVREQIASMGFVDTVMRIATNLIDDKDVVASAVRALAQVAVVVASTPKFDPAKTIEFLHTVFTKYSSNAIVMDVACAVVQSLATDPEFHKHFKSSPIARDIKHVIANTVEDWSTQFHSLFAAANLAIGASLKEEFGNEEMVKLVLTSFDTHSSKKTVVRAALNVMWELSVHVDLYHCMLSCGWVNRIKSALHTFATEPTVVEPALSIFRNFATNADTALELLHDNVLESFVDVMNACPADKKAALAIMKCYWELTAHDKVRQAIEQTDIVSFLRVALENNSDCADVVVAALATLRNLAVDQHMRTDLSSQEILGLVKQAVTTNPNHPKVQEMAHRFLFNILPHEQAALAIQEANLLEDSLEALQRHLDAPIVVQVVCRVVADCAIQSDVSRQIVDMGFIPVLQSAMLTHPDNEVIQESALSALWELSANLDHVAVLVASNVLANLLDATRHLSSARVCQALCGVLRNLASHATVKSRLIKDGYLKLMCDILVLHVDSLDVLAPALACIWNVSVTALAKTEFIALGLLPHLKALLTKYADNSSLCVSCSAIAWNIGYKYQHGHDAVVAADLVPLLRAAYATHSSVRDRYQRWIEQVGEAPSFDITS